MKLTIALCIVVLMQVNANTYSQNISLHVRNAPLENVLTMISKQSGYNFIYNSIMLKEASPVTLEVKDKSLDEVLVLCFKDQPLTYVLNDNTVVIKKRPETKAIPAIITELPEVIPPITITGRVVSEDGTPVANASVMIKGTSQGTSSNSNGEFSITVPDRKAVLVISSIGYKQQEVSIGNRDHIDVIMQKTEERMEDVVVVGYGTTASRDLTAPIVTIKNDEITKQPVSNAASALQGKVAGMVISNDGKPGSSPFIMIRGLGTVESSSKPLFVVDDVFMDDISFLASSDIESVTVLKDASSSAIYGIRAANGVIIITTKKGAKNKSMQISLNAYTGFQQGTNLLPMAGRDEYITLINEKMYSSYLRDTANSSYIPLDPAKFSANTDWFDEILRGAAWMQNYDVSVSGGSEKSTYYFGIGYLNQDGLLKNNNYQRITLRGAQDFFIGKHVKTGYNATLSGWREHAPVDVFAAAFISPPVFAPKDANGNFTDPTGIGQFSNPAATQYYYNNENDNIRALVNAYLEVKPVNDITIRTSFTPDIRTTFSKTYIPHYRISTIQYDTGSLTKESDYNINYVWDNTATYDKNFGDHKLKAMVGFSAVSTGGEYLNVKNINVPYYTDATLYFNNGPSSGFSVGNAPYAKVKSTSYYGRINYSFKNRYLLTATLRRDGSSSFPADNRWSTFPSIGLGWIMSSENFMDKVKFLDYLKIRAAYGELGNANVPVNAYTALTEGGPYYSAIFGPYGSTNIDQGRNNIGSVNQIKWEKTSEYDIGFDATLFNYRLTAVVDYYRRVTSNAVFQLKPLMVAGAGQWATQSANVAWVLNRGVEVSLNWNDNITDKISYRVGGNITTIHNEILKLAPGVSPYYDANVFSGNQATFTQKGRPVGDFNVYQAIGVFQNLDEVKNYKDKNGNVIMPNAVPGDLKYADLNGDGILDKNDRVGVGSYLPKLLYGFNIGLNIHQFDISADFQGVAGNKIYNKKRVNRFGNENYDINFFNHCWHGEGSSNSYPSADVAGGMNSIPNTFFVESGNYFRLRNLQIGYQLPEQVLSKTGIKKLRIFITAQNLFTFFKYKGYSPEIVGAGNFDTMQTATNMGLDNGIYPLSRIINFGVNMAF